MSKQCSYACDHGYRRSYMSIFLPLWSVVTTFFTASVLGMGWSGTLSAIVVTIAMFASGDVYEYARDRFPAPFQGYAQGVWMARFLLYVVLVPIVPMVIMYLLWRCGAPGLSYPVQHGFWSAACSLACMFGFLRICGMPTSVGSICKPLRHVRAAPDLSLIHI